LKSHFDLRHSHDLKQNVQKLLEKVGAASGYLKRIMVKTGGGIIFLKTDKIDWIEAADNYVNIHAGSQSHLLRETISGFAAKLDPEKFVQINRANIVNLDRLKSVQSWSHGEMLMTLENGKQLLLTRRYRDNLLARFGYSIQS
jgi:two-component system LytT family response regulator